MPSRKIPLGARRPSLCSGHAGGMHGAECQRMPWQPARGTMKWGIPGVQMPRSGQRVVGAGAGLPTWHDDALYD
eukprot:654139-Alexandrium_andersonii.AAC.1